LWCYHAGIHAAALFNPKARQWVHGRKDIFKRLSAAIAPSDKVIWMHCASLGEFEQGRPLLEAIRESYPQHKILLTFFSPSGYEVQKNYTGANWVFYLPLDGSKRAKKFLDIVHPELVIFVKYEFWFFYLKKLSYRNIPLLLVSALFRKEMNFFRWYGSLSRKMASRFNHIFVQNKQSKDLLAQIKLGPISSVAGDTRFDRVVTIAQQAKPIETVITFSQGMKLFIAGSTWPIDEKCLAEIQDSLYQENCKLVIAPHEIDEPHLLSLENLFPQAVRLSNFRSTDYSKQVLIIDNYGMLSRLYQHATIAYIGGGLQTSGIHNTLEAAVYGIPVLFGPHYKKYAEAIELVNCGGGIPLPVNQNYATELKQLAHKLLSNDELRAQTGTKAKEFVQAQKGATQIILDYIQEKRLLTN
jgi:3-deoxy-D-manno-octulosonic-acid transferase